jgi:prepilin-type N-terminal cleavage/methylation domain-containing protein
MLAKFRALGNRGDTIVEVMIVLAVLGLAISISYATANRSLKSARQAQENSEATAYVQSQIESLKKLSTETAASGGYLYNRATPFCVLSLSAVPPIEPSSANCVFGKNNLYKILIYYCDKVSPVNTTPCISTSHDDLFIVQAKWPNISGDGSDDSVTMSYRVHAQ